MPSPCIEPRVPLCQSLPPAVDAEAAYRVAAAGTGAGRCQLGAWLLPEACILPLPTTVVGQLGQWERTSLNLNVNARAKEAMRGGWAALGTMLSSHTLCNSQSPAGRLICPPSRAARAVFLPHFEGEMAAVNDTSLQQEVDLLTKLINA